ncbi:MAG: hypothetical protein GY851_24275 [bacterium]|nr:hypothetical protein [bacterium]
MKTCGLDELLDILVVGAGPAGLSVLPLSDPSWGKPRNAQAADRLSTPARRRGMH